MTYDQWKLSNPWDDCPEEEEGPDPDQLHDEFMERELDFI